MFSLCIEKCIKCYRGKIRCGGMRRESKWRMRRLDMWRRWLRSLNWILAVFWSFILKIRVMFMNLFQIQIEINIQICFMGTQFRRMRNLSSWRFSFLSLSFFLSFSFTCVLWIRCFYSFTVIGSFTGNG